MYIHDAVARRNRKYIGEIGQVKQWNGKGWYNIKPEGPDDEEPIIKCRVSDIEGCN